MQICVHTLVKNEERYLWFAVTSVIGHVDKVMLWDTGSTDRTLAIIEELKKRYPEKIEFRERKITSPEDFTNARQEMLNVTKSDWFMVVDGDEIWWEDSIKKVTDFIRKNGDKYESVVVPTINLVGDIFHYQSETTGKYKIAGKTGHYNLRAVNTKIPGLQALGPHGQMGWADGQEKMIQDRDSSRIKFIDAPYIHATNLVRAGKGKDNEVIKRKKKMKYEFGLPFPKDFYYPEVFFKDRPDAIESPWARMSRAFKFRAYLETPLKKIKRRILPARVGY